MLGCPRTNGGGSCKELFLSLWDDVQYKQIWTCWMAAGRGTSRRTVPRGWAAAARWTIDFPLCIFFLVHVTKTREPGCWDFFFSCMLNRLFLLPPQGSSSPLTHFAVFRTCHAPPSPTFYPLSFFLSAYFTPLLKNAAGSHLLQEAFLDFLFQVELRISCFLRHQTYNNTY